MNYLGRVKESEKVEEIKLDNKDKKILKELFKDARIPISKIAKNIKTSKEVVNYRLKRLKQKGILIRTTPFIDVTKLGYNINIIYLQLQSLTEEKEKELIEFFINHKFVKVVATCTGNWDLFVVFCSKNLKQEDTIFKEFEIKLGNNLKEYRLVTILEECYLPFRYLFEKYEEQNKKISNIRIKLDNKDKEILKLLTLNGRIPLIEISKKLNIPPDTIKYRIKKFINSRLITKFIPLINISKLNYHWYIISVHLHNSTQKQEQNLIQFLKSQKNIVFIIKTVGQWYIECDVHVKSSNELRKIFLGIRNKFSNIIESFESTLVFNDYKYTHLPEGLLE